MKSLYKHMGGTYRQEGDYFVPNLALLDTDAYRLGKYGRIRRRYLKEHSPALYNTMLLGGTLHRHLAEIDQTCHEAHGAHLHRYGGPGGRKRGPESL